MPSPAQLASELELALIPEGIAAAEQPPLHPSSFGPLRLPAHGQLPELVLLAAAGIPPERLSGLWAARDEPGFEAALVTLGARLATRAPRLVRQLAWQLVRETPRRVQSIVDAFVEADALSQPGTLSLLIDLAEESPRAFARHAPALLHALLREDTQDPLDAQRHLSDLFCLLELPSDFVRDAVFPVWTSAPGARARSVLLRACVFHRAAPLMPLTGKLAERVHHPKTRYQSYSYRLYADGVDYRLVDLTRALQQNGSELPKYAPSMYLRRHVGKLVVVEGFVDRAADDPTLLLRELADAEPPSHETEAKTKAREARPQGPRTTGPLTPRAREPETPSPAPAHPRDPPRA